MRLIDAEALLKHQIESDRMGGGMLVVGKGHILCAPTIDPGSLVQTMVEALEAWESVHIGGSYQGIGKCPKCGNSMPSISHKMCQGCAVKLTVDALQRYRGEKE